MLGNELVLDVKAIEKEYGDNPLEFFKGKKMCLFKACLEKYFPAVRFGMKDLLEVLNLSVVPCDNSCCAGTFFQRNLITRAQFAAINERNLNEIAHQADILLVSCNGCYNSLLRGRDFLNTPEVRKKTEKILEDVKKEMGGELYPGQYQILENLPLKISHDLDFIYLLRNEVLNTLKFDLRGLKVAVHYGCHYLNLERDKRLENGLSEDYFKDKTKLEELVQLFGGIPVDYQERESCCGWGASQIVIHKNDALKITYRKLKSAENVGADFLLMPCPTCLYTLSKPEFREDMKKLFNDDNLDIPTIHINELIAILRGCEEESCITIRRKTPRIEEIFDIITNQ
ncbi:MAG: heterodisulfide reductase-related iron-sulfur binding cluster [Promethearchaeota archaeon]